MKRARLGLAALLVAVPLLLVAACASGEKSGAASPTSAASPPARAEILTAFKRLAPRKGFDYQIKLDPKPEEANMSAFIWLKTVTQNADGRWLASAELVPPAWASTNPLPIFIAKDADGWRLATSTEAAVLRTASPSPIASATLQPQ